MFSKESKTERAGKHIFQIYTKALIAAILLTVIITGLAVRSVAYAADNQPGQSNTDNESILQAANKAIEDEEGSMFEKILARIVVSVAAALHTFGRKLLGFKSLDALIFNKGVENPDVIMNQQWTDAMNNWFKIMQTIAAPVIFIAVIITAFRFIKAAANPKAREEAIEAVERLLLSAMILLLAPVFVSVLLKVNNALVESLKGVQNGSADNALGLSDTLIGSIKTGSPLLTSLVIILFAFLEFRLNIMFFMRMFSITILYIFTPFVTALWTIEKSVNAAGVWMGEIISNIFMQFAYAFVFTVFLVFVPYMGTGGTLICAMIIIPMAEMIRNSVQNLWIRLSGFDEAGASMKAAGILGTVAALPTLGKTIAAQFGGLGSVGKALGLIKGRGSTSAGGGPADTSPAGGSPAGEGMGAAEAAAAGATINVAANNAQGSAPGTHNPVMGGSVSNARANVITGLGVVQGVSNIAQTAVHAVTALAAMPAGEAGQKLAAGAGALTGAAVRAVGTPLAMTGAALATSIQSGKGVKGFGHAWKEMTGVQGRGWNNNIKAAYRSVQIMGNTIIGGFNAGADAIYHQQQIDALDRMRP